MRKIIIVMIMMISIFGFSQEKPNEKVSQFDVQLRWKQARLRLDQNIGNIKYPFRFELIGRSDRADISVGMRIPLGEETFFTTSIGEEYIYDTGEWNPLLAASFRSKFKYGIIRINYGSNWIDNHGVSSSLMYNLFGPLIRVGVSSRNEFIGGRTEFQFNFGKKSNKKFRIHLAYFPKEKRFDYGIRFRFAEVFPKLQEKIDEVNPFKKK